MWVVVVVVVVEDSDLKTELHLDKKFEKCRMISLKDHFHLYFISFFFRVIKLQGGTARETNMKRLLSHLNIYYLNYNHA